jgi:hypothetical protein
MTRECHARFCERLGVQFPGPTRHSRHARHPGVPGSAQVRLFGPTVRVVIIDSSPLGLMAH